MPNGVLLSTLVDDDDDADDDDDGSVVPMDRSCTVNSGTNAAVLPKGKSPPQTQELRSRFYYG